VAAREAASGRVPREQGERKAQSAKFGAEIGRDLQTITEAAPRSAGSERAKSPKLETETGGDLLTITVAVPKKPEKNRGGYSKKIVLIFCHSSGFRAQYACYAAFLLLVNPEMGAASPAPPSESGRHGAVVCCDSARFARF
jgi:hypothetical protein